MFLISAGSYLAGAAFLSLGLFLLLNGEDEALSRHLLRVLRLKPPADAFCEIDCAAPSASAPLRVLRDNARDNSLTPCDAL